MKSSKPRQQQIIFVAVLGGTILMMLGIIFGFLLGKGRTAVEQAPTVLPVYNEVGLGLTREDMANLMSAQASGGYQFELTQGGLYDYYRGSSKKFDGVTLLLNGPPGELQQIGVVFEQRNLGHRVQLQSVLKTIFEKLKTTADTRSILTWIDATTPQVSDSKITATSLAGKYRLLLRDASGKRDAKRTLLMIEPAVVVTWRRE